MMREQETSIGRRPSKRRPSGLTYSIFVRPEKEAGIVGVCQFPEVLEQIRVLAFGILGFYFYICIFPAKKIIKVCLKFCII